MYVFIGIVAILVCVLLFYLQRNNHYWQKRNVPFVKPQLLFGNFREVFTLRKHIGIVLEEYYNSTIEKILGLYLLDEPVLLIRDPELIKAILIKDFKYFSDHVITQNFKSDPIGSSGLLLLKGTKWKEIRKRMSTAFSSSKMRTMFEDIQGSGKELLEYLDELTVNSKIVDVRDVISYYTTQYLTGVAFGIKSKCFKNKNCIFKKITQKILNFDNNLYRAFEATSYFIAPALVKVFGLKFLDNFSTRTLKEIFWNNVEERTKRGLHREDVVSIIQKMLCEYEGKTTELDKDMLIGQAVQFFSAGHETTVSTLSFALYEMARNPEVQDKLREEIFNIIDKYGSITYESMSEMKYLSQCIDETLRLYPLLPFLDRRCNDHYKIPNTDIVIEKGTSVFISLNGLHYDNHYFSDPEKFDPERFSQGTSQYNFTYLPFGEGPRICYGKRLGLLSSKSGLAHILSKYEVQLIDTQDGKLTFNPVAFVLIPVNGIHLKFRKLEQRR